MTGTIKFSGLSQNRAKQSDPKITWDMFHKIYHMYIDIKNKEETNAALLLTCISDQREINNVSQTTVN